MDINTMTMSEVEVRLAEIGDLITQPDADLDALNTEVDQLIARRAALLEEVETRAALAGRVAAGLEGVTLRGGNEMPVYNASSPEYRSAWLHTLMGIDLSEEERAAYVATTSNTSAVVPTTVLDNIWNLVNGQHAIIGDVSVYRTGTVIEVIKHTAITQGAAAKVGENEANDDEINTFVKVTLSGNDFSKSLDISYALERMSVDSFEQYLASEIAAGLGDALAEDCVDNAIIANMDSGNAVESEEVGKLSFAEVAATFGLLKRAGSVAVYGTRKTIYTYLVGMVDTARQLVFQPSAQAGAAGTILGAPIKIEDAVDDGVLLIGDPSKVTYNMVQDIMIESAKDIKKHVTTYSGYARGEGALIDPTAFATLTVKSE